MGSRVLFVSCCLWLAGCATFSALKSPSGDYHKYVDSHLQVKRAFDRGRELIIAKILPVTELLREEQNELTPMQRPYLKPELKQVVMAVNVAGKEPMNVDKWELRLGGMKSTYVEEIVDAEVIEREYYFAYPFYRVFVVSFPSQSEVDVADDFQIVSPYGKLAFESRISSAERRAAGERH